MLDRPERLRDGRGAVEFHAVTLTVIDGECIAREAEAPRHR
jgi:hypothetical protein